MSTGTMIGLILVALVASYLFIDYYLLKKGFDLSRTVKSLAIGLFFIGIGLFLFIYMSIGTVSEALDLSKNGIETIGIVTKSETVHKTQRGKKRTYHYSTVNYDGYTDVLSLDQDYSVGSKLSIVYSSMNPKTTMVGKQKAGFIEYCFDDKSVLDLFIIFGLPITFICIGTYNLKGLFPKEAKLDTLENT
jgi:hypothetical protein